MTTVETVKAVVTADASQYNREMGRADGKMAGLAKSAKKAAGVAGKAFTAAAGVIAVKSITAFAGFETKMQEVRTLMPELTDEAFGKMGDDIKNFGKEFGVLTDDSIPALYQAISAGVPQDNVFEFLETAQMAARGGVTDLETAVDGISSVVNAYGSDLLVAAGASVSAAEASDLMFTAVKLGKTDFEQLSSSLFNVAPAASALGIKFGDVTAGLASLTAMGTPTSVATTQLRAAFVELGKDGTKAGDAFANVAGQSFPDFIAAGGDMVGAVKIMAQAAEEGGTSVMNLFGSIEGGQAIQSLAGDIEGFQSNVQDMNESAGATETAFNEMDQGLAASMSKIKANAEVMMIEIGEKLAPVVERAMNWIIENFDEFKRVGKQVFDTVRDAIKKAIPTFKEIAEVVIDLGKKGVAKLQDAFKKMQPAIKAIVGFVEDLVDAFSKNGLSGVLDELMGKLRPVTDWMQRNKPIMGAFGALVGTVVVMHILKLAKAFGKAKLKALQAAASFVAANASLILIPLAIAALVAGLIWAYQNVDWFRKAVDGLVSFIKKNWEKTFEKMKEAVVNMFKVVRPMVENFVGIFVDTVQLLKALFEGDFSRVWEEAKSIISGFVQHAINLFTLAPRLLWAAIGGGLTTLWGKLSGWVTGKAKALGTLIVGWKNAIVGFPKGLWTDISSALVTLWGKISGWVTGRVAVYEMLVAKWRDAIVGFTTGLWTAMKSKLVTLWKKMRDWVTGKKEQLETLVVGWREAVVGFITGIPAKIASGAVGMFDGIKNSFLKAINWIIDKWNTIDIGIDISMPAWLGGKGFKIDDIFPDVARLAKGGTITRSGTVMVGEAGPEFLNLPTGAEVRPLSAGPGGGGPGGGGGGGGTSINVVVNLPPGSDGADVVAALQSYARSHGGSIPILTGQL